MSEEAPGDLLPVEMAPAPESASPHRSPGVRRKLGHWLAELTTVFIGVYAAFFLNYRANNRQQRQRHEQLLAWVEERYTGVLDNSRKQVPELREIIDRFNAKLAAGEMPEVKPIGWVGDYDPSDGTALLQSGGYELLEIETIHDIREVESSLRQLVAIAQHAQQRSDTLILPNRGKEAAVFYDPATRRLREPYEWVPGVYKDLQNQFTALDSTCTKLLAQVHAERQRVR